MLAVLVDLESSFAYLNAMVGSGLLVNQIVILVVDDGGDVIYCGKRGLVVYMYVTQTIKYFFACPNGVSFSSKSGCIKVSNKVSVA